MAAARVQSGECGDVNVGTINTDEADALTAKEALSATLLQFLIHQEAFIDALKDLCAGIPTLMVTDGKWL